MARTFNDCADIYARRRKGNEWKRLSHNQVLLYDAEANCYQHKHHSTITVEIYPDRYKVYTQGWFTNTTLRKIHEFVPVWICRKPCRTLTGEWYVVWGDQYVPFYDGIEVDRLGVPLEIVPVEKWRLRKKATTAFTAVAKQVRSALCVRAALGEWNDCELREAHPSVIWNLMQKVAYHPDVFLSTEELGPLFARRPQCVFGRPRRYFHGTGPAVLTSEKRLESNITAARQYWITQAGDAVYETYEEIAGAKNDD